MGWYPGAQSPAQLWANILSKRQAFRRFREERMPAALYHSADPRAEDRTHGELDGLVFDLAARRLMPKDFLVFSSLFVVPFLRCKQF